MTPLKPNHQVCAECGGHGFIALTTGQFQCEHCDGTGQIPIVLTPGIYGQTGIPPIVMAWDQRGEPSRREGPFYLIAYGPDGSCLVWQTHKLDPENAIAYDYCGLATPEECERIEPWII